MKQIPLTRGQSAIVDDHWFDYLNQWKWHAQWNEYTKSFYACRKVKKENSWKEQKVLFMHNVVANTPAGMLCDHIHHNTLDNREDELRNVTKSQNCINKRIQKSNTSGVVGVFRRKERGTYKAKLTFEGRTVLNKTFKTLDEAVQAREFAEKKYFGEYANQNK
ncbi:MAG: hypothetical protein IPI97_14865 [Nitrosomonas sp.]|nr:hypothetical protein [Nitrosomonas sp.]